MEHPTRLISRTTDTPTQGDSVPQPDTADTTQRLASELEYVAHFATAFGSLLGLNLWLFGVLDDRESQTTLIQTHGVWTGSISSTRHPIKQAQNALIRP